MHFAVIDVDISRKMLISNSENEEMFSEYLKRAARTAENYQHILHEMGLKTYIEFSGYRGYHVWLFFNEWIQIRYIYSLFEIIQGKAGENPEGITTEYFPVKNKKKAGRSGQNIKLPFGIHVISGKRSCFLDDDFMPVNSIEGFLGTVARYTSGNIKKVVGGNIDCLSAVEQCKRKKVELDYSVLKTTDESVLTVLKGCSLMQYLVNKSITTGYLGHFERLSVLHVFGHLGEGGKEFVHEVMSFTINYQYNITQRFIVKIPAKPVSCVKLQDQYKQITAEYGCSCAFKRTKNCYPSPVIHALKDNSEENHEITIPTSRTITQAKKEQVYEELNVRSRIRELANKLLELKKQRRGIDKALVKVEKELNNIFDNTGQDCIEIDEGLLSRKKTEQGYEWRIEL